MFGFAPPIQGGLGPLRTNLMPMQQPQQQPQPQAPNVLASLGKPMSMDQIMGGLRQAGILPQPGAAGAGGAAPPAGGAAGGTGLPATYDPSGMNIGPLTLPGGAAGAGAGAADAGTAGAGAADAAAPGAMAAAGGGGFGDFLAALFA